MVVVRGESWERERKTASASVKKERLMKKERERERQPQERTGNIDGRRSKCLLFPPRRRHTHFPSESQCRTGNSFVLSPSPYLLHLLTVVRKVDRLKEISKQTGEKVPSD